MMEIAETLEPTVEAPHIAVHTYLMVEFQGEMIAEYPVTDGSMTIGRTSDNHIRIKDTNVSRLHAQILTVDNHSLLEDMGSRNGTYFARKLIKRRAMKPGDRFRIGGYDVYLMQRQAVNEVASLIGDWDRGIEPDITLEVPVPIF